MTLYRNRYSDGTYGWFPTWHDAHNNANAFHPAGLMERCEPIEIDTRNRKTLADSLKRLEHQHA